MDSLSVWIPGGLGLLTGLGFYGIEALPFFKIEDISIANSSSKLLTIILRIY